MSDISLEAKLTEIKNGIKDIHNAIKAKDNTYTPGNLEKIKTTITEKMTIGGEDILPNSLNIYDNYFLTKTKANSNLINEYINFTYDKSTVIVNNDSLPIFRIKDYNLKIHGKLVNGVFKLGIKYYKDGEESSAIIDQLTGLIGLTNNTNLGNYNYYIGNYYYLDENRLFLTMYYENTTVYNNDTLSVKTAEKAGSTLIGIIISYNNNKFSYASKDLSGGTLSAQELYLYKNMGRTIIPISKDDEDNQYFSLVWTRCYKNSSTNTYVEELLTKLIKIDKSNAITINTAKKIVSNSIGTAFPSNSNFESFSLFYTNNRIDTRANVNNRMGGYGLCCEKAFTYYYKYLSKKIQFELILLTNTNVYNFSEFSYYNSLNELKTKDFQNPLYILGFFENQNTLIGLQLPETDTINSIRVYLLKYDLVNKTLFSVINGENPYLTIALAENTSYTKNDLSFLSGAFYQNNLLVLPNLYKNAENNKGRYYFIEVKNSTYSLKEKIISSLTKKDKIYNPNYLLSYPLLSSNYSNDEKGIVFSSEIISSSV